MLSDLDAVLIASDSDVPVKPGVLNTVMPEGPDEKSKVMRGVVGTPQRTTVRACVRVRVRPLATPVHARPAPRSNAPGTGQRGGARRLAAARGSTPSTPRKRHAAHAAAHASLGCSR